ncbi:MAG: Serine phosphatase RsbU, regulator of sigma subunit [Acidimicrobiales bacterium]|nr:Serine phosphatase RsbU, regulator of sigma subunit [Acidimicrobiales bacterium]
MDAVVTEGKVGNQAAKGDEINGSGTPSEHDLAPDLARLLDAAARLTPGDGPTLVDAVRHVLNAQDARLFVADYSLRCLQEIDVSGPVGGPNLMVGTIAGRAFTSGEVTVTGDSPTVVSIPLVDGTDRIGILELDYEPWAGNLPDGWERVVAVFVMTLIVTSRYSDLWVRARRSEPLTAAAEVQWDLLPPLSCSTDDVAVSGILEPAYEIGGDSFDYAINGAQLQFAIVDAIGHGMSAVLMSAAAINSLRSARRTGTDIVAAFRGADQLIQTRFGDSYYVTGQFGSLDFDTGILTWVNAGHVLPMLVRNGTYAGELTCTPSMPLGLGGPVVEVATHQLQRGDRLLFYTDGITESRSPDGEHFGRERLSDFLVRAALDGVPVAETARRLSANVIDYVDEGLNDDATLLLIEYRERDSQTQAMV